MINQSELKELLHYSVITGQFFWIKPRKSVKVGAIAGNLQSDGYMRICINGKLYLAHRLAWFWVTGEWSKHEIDHKNGVRNANWWLNIREANRSQNACNAKLSLASKSGYKGVVWHSLHKKWQAQIVLNKKQKYLGLFDDIEAAYAERLKAEKELHRDFARV